MGHVIIIPEIGPFHLTSSEKAAWDRIRNRIAIRPDSIPPAVLVLWRISRHSGYRSEIKRIHECYPEIKPDRLAEMVIEIMSGHPGWQPGHVAADLAMRCDRLRQETVEAIETAVA